MRSKQASGARLIEFASVLEKSPTADDLWARLLGHLKMFEIDHVIYITCDANRSSVELRTNLPFQELPDLQHFDPFLKYCCDSYEATRTGAAYLDDYPYLDDESREFIQNAEKFGFRSGLGLPVKTDTGGRYGGFNLGTALDRATFEAEIMPLEAELRTFLLIAHHRLVELESADDAKTEVVSISNTQSHNDIQLTEREKDILYLLSKGYSRKECARFCDLSVHTVSDYVKSIYKKLGVTTRYAARERAQFLGLLSSRSFP